MAAFNRFRLFHWLLAGSFVAVYLTGDDAELAHIWLGYGLLLLLLIRLLLAPFKPRGFPRLAPALRAWRRPDRAAVGRWLTFAALSCFAVASLIGLGMVDNGEVLARAIPGVQPDLFGAASGDFLAGLDDPEEVHEFFANLAMGLVGLHIGFVLLFRWQMAWSMLRGLPKRPAPSVPARKVAPATGEATAPSFQRLTVSGRHAETADACSFELIPPAGDAAWSTGKPGQFLALRVPHESGPMLRCYSLSRAPSAGQPLRITVKRVEGGRASNWLLDHLQPGDSIEAMPPVGSFTPASLDADLLLIGAGSGITPLFAILQSVLERGRGRICLFYTNRDQSSAIFADELNALRQRYPQRLRMANWLTSTEGLPDAAVIASAIRDMSGDDWQHPDCFICGPEAFMTSARDALLRLTIPKERIHLERFAPGVGAPVRSVATGGDSRLDVRLQGRHYELKVSPGQVLMDAMEQAGLQPPNACRAGLCGACRCKVVAGRASMRSNQILDEDEVRRGWVLACQAEPASRELQVEF